jgi:hypothetical protein
VRTGSFIREERVVGFGKFEIVRRQEPRLSPEAFQHQASGRRLTGRRMIWHSDST